MEKDKDSGYFKEWYKREGKALNESRRERYKTDPAYREEVLRRNKAARLARKAESAPARLAERKARKVTARTQWKTKTIVIDGKEVVMVTIGALAKALGRSVQAIRIWERQKLLPCEPYRNDKGDRFYTLDQVEQIKTALSKSGRLSNEPPVHKSPVFSELRTIEYPSGQTNERCFSIGILAKVVARSVVTMEQLERRGVLPQTPFRDATTGYRLYTVQMIESVKEAFDAHPEPRGEEWDKVKSEISSAWQKSGVMQAKLIATKPEDPLTEE